MIKLQSKPLWQLSREMKISFSALVTLFALATVAASAQDFTGPSLETAENDVDHAQGFIEFAGSVGDMQGRAIADAEVIYPYAFDRRTTRTISADTVSNQAGKFVLRVPQSGVDDGSVAYPESLLWVYSKGYCLGTARVQTDGDGGKPALSHIQLMAETDTSLVIVAPDGLPMEDVLVEPINYKTSSGFSLVPSQLKDKLAQRTNAKGRVNFPAFSGDQLFIVWASSEKYGTQSQQFNPSADAPAERTIQLRNVGQILGIIPEHDLQWTLKVKLWFTSTEDMQAGQARPPWPTEGIAKANVDAFGRIRVPLIAEGRVRIQTLVDDSLSVRPTLPDEIQVRAGELTKFEMPMKELIRIHGSLVARDDKAPLPGIRIHVYYGRYYQGTDVVTDEHGRFTAMVLPGEVRLQLMNLYSTEYMQLGRPGPIEVKAEGSVLPPIEAVLAEPRDGTVINQIGRPVANATVSAYIGSWLCSSATSNEEGRFRIPKMPASISSDQATYKVHLDEGDTIRLAEVSLESASPIVLRIGL